MLSQLPAICFAWVIVSLAFLNPWIPDATKPANGKPQHYYWFPLVVVLARFLLHLGCLVGAEGDSRTF